MNELISVIVPVWNSAAYLVEALQSVLRQGIPALQLIVVDDGSTDDTAQVVQQFQPKVTYLYQANQGPAAARNRGLQAATGTFVAFIDADDLWAAGRLQRQLSALQTTPTKQMVQGQIQYLHLVGNHWQPHAAPFFSMSLTTALFRRELFAQVGLLDPSLRHCEDVDWFFRAQSQGITLYQQAAVAVYYRRHTGNLTNQFAQVRQNTLRVVMKHQARKTSNQRSGNRVGVC